MILEDDLISGFIDIVEKFMIHLFLYVFILFETLVTSPSLALHFD